MVWFNYLCLGFGFLLAVLFQLQRAPKIFNGIWADEMAYNWGFFASGPWLHELSKNVCYLMRPFLEAAMKKWVWFQLLAPTEAGLSVIPWLYAGISLLLILFIAWTHFNELRLFGVVLLGLCLPEITYSTEAQGYSFVSTMSLGFVFCLGWSLQQLSVKKIRNAFWIFLGGWALALNTHFFGWPYFFAAAGFFSLCFFQSLYDAEKKAWMLRLFAGYAAIAGSTLVMNMYPLYNLLLASPGASEEFTFRGWRAFNHMRGTWEWANLPVKLFIGLVVTGWFHPIRWKRQWSWAIGIAIGPALYVAFLAIFGKSDYMLSDRYMLSYIAPVMLGILLGLESIAYWTAKVKGSLSRWVLVGIIAFLTVQYFGEPLRQLPRQAKAGWQSLISTPWNYSGESRYFEKVKSFQKPTLVLSNRCWLYCIPDIYLNYMGTKTNREPARILITTGCETPRETLIGETNQFLSDHQNTGIVAIYFNSDGLENPSLPCRDSVPSLYQQVDPAGTECFAIYEPRAIEPWLRQHTIGPKNQTVPPSLASEPGNISRFFRKTVAPLLFYLVPLILFGIFILVLRKPVHK